MMERDILANLYQKCLILCSKILFQYERNSSVTMVTYWVPDLPILEAFLATFAIPFRSLLTALHMHDPASI